MFLTLIDEYGEEFLLSLSFIESIKSDVLGYAVIETTSQVYNTKNMYEDILHLLKGAGTCMNL